MTVVHALPMLLGDTNNFCSGLLNLDVVAGGDDLVDVSPCLGNEFMTSNLFDGLMIWPRSAKVVGQAPQYERVLKRRAIRSTQRLRDESRRTLCLLSLTLSRNPLG